MENREEIKKKIESMSKEELVDFYINNQKIETELNWYKEQLALLNKLRFSSTSERLITGQLNLFNEVEDTFDHVAESAEIVEVTKAKKKKSREANFAKLPTKIIEHVEENKHCEQCGNVMKELAPQIIDVLKYQPARYTIERHIVHQYICRECTDENLEAEIVVAEGAPKRLIKGSVVSPSVVAGLAFNKYVNCTPLYRQEQQLKREKVEISRANMSNWLMTCGEKLRPIYDQMIADIRLTERIHMDETTVTVLENKDERQNNYMWMMCSGKWETNQMVIYSYHKNREHSYAKTLLGEDFKGGVHCDAYEAYHQLGDKVAIFGCFAHCRRYFNDALEVSPLHKKGKTLKGKALDAFCAENPAYGNILKIMEYIRELFKYEEDYIALNLAPDEIRQKRQEDQSEKLEELFTLIEKHQKEYSTQSKAGKAITYALNQKQYLTNYLNDGKAEICNNLGERKIKPFVLGRKNWLFSNTISGAEMSSIYFSLVESAKMNQLDIHKYLEYILEEIQNNESPEYKKLLPYSSDLPEQIRIN